MLLDAGRSERPSPETFGWVFGSPGRVLAFYACGGRPGPDHGELLIACTGWWKKDRHVATRLAERALCCGWRPLPDDRYERRVGRQVFKLKLFEERRVGSTLVHVLVSRGRVR